MGIERRILRWGVFVIPFLYLLPGPLWNSHRLSFTLLGLLLVGAFMPVRSMRMMVWYIGAWVLVAMFLHMVFPSRPFTNPLRTVMYVFGACAVMMAVVYDGGVGMGYFHRTIRVVIIVNTMYALVTWAWGDPFAWAMGHIVPVQSLTYDSAWCSVGFGNPNFYAGAVAISAPYFINRRWWPALVVCVSVMLMARTFGASLAMIGVGFVYARAYKMETGKMISVGVILLVFAFGLNNNPLTQMLHNERFSWWATAWTGITSSPIYLLLGHGPGSFPSTPPLHNDFLTMWWQYGALGVGMLMWVIVRLCRSSLHVEHTASLVAFVIFMLSSRPMQMPMLALLGLVTCGLIVRSGCPGQT